MLHVGAILRLCAFCGNSTINMQLMCLLLPHSTVPNPNRSKNHKANQISISKDQTQLLPLIQALDLSATSEINLVTSCNYIVGHRLRPISCWLAGRNPLLISFDQVTLKPLETSNPPMAPDVSQASKTGDGFAMPLATS